MRNWDVVIGIETHVQLNTKSKIFSGASTAFGAQANTQACAIDLGFPGVLPVLNRQAVNCAIKFALAVEGRVAEKSVFARKNYFYPDLPKGYQISQFELPVVCGGKINIHLNQSGKRAIEKTINLTRAHLEEDAGKSLHEDFHGKSGLDFNRAGTPLLEIVSEPEMFSSDEAVAYAKTLHALVCWIGICDGNLQEGSVRFDANVSLKKKDSQKLGTRREIKNLNSFRFLKEAIEAEINWQIEQLEDGYDIEQATVLFDPERGETRSMRSKEDAHDYRYFPDPDLLPLHICSEDILAIKNNMPELPKDKKNRYIKDLLLSSYDAEFLTANLEIAHFFEESLRITGNKSAKLCANWLMGEISAQLNRQELSLNQAPITPNDLAQLVLQIENGNLSHNMAKKVFEILWQNTAEHKLSVDEIIVKHGLKQISDGDALSKIIREVIDANPHNVAEFNSGKEKALNSLVGQVMKVAGGKANPQQASQLLRQLIAEQN